MDPEPTAHTEPNAPANTSGDVPSRIDTLTKLGAAFVASIYLCGFVVVTVSQARFGIVEFSIIRPKILSAGVGLLMLCAIPVLIHLTVFRVWGFGLPALKINPLLPTTNKQRQLKKSLTVTVFVVLNIYTAFVLGLLILPFKIQLDEWRLFTAFFNFTVMISCLMLFAGRWFERQPIPFTATVISLNVGLLATIIALAAHVSGAYFALFGWFLLVTSIVRWGPKVWPRLKTFNPGALLFVFLLLTYYSTLLYPRIKPEFGGGLSPTVIVFVSDNNRSTLPKELFVFAPEVRAFFDRNFQPRLEDLLQFQRGNVIAGRLLDEISDGYYLEIFHQEGAFFLPRTSVAAIQFRSLSEECCRTDR
jgi:hypothetical protein